MIKGIITHGQILPLQPLPADWHEGQPLCIDREDDASTTLDMIDRDFAELHRLCSDNDLDDELLLEQSLSQSKERAKEQVRRQMERL